MARFGQHSRIHAKPGERDALVAKFLQVVEMQRDNPACELMLVSTSPEDDDSVFLTEVWTSEDDWQRARESREVERWAEAMPSLVAGPPEITRLDPVGVES